MASMDTAEGKPIRLPSGIDGLDTVLRGGFMAGALYIVQGPPGSGKTILGNQICFNHGAKGGKALYMTLLAESHARMLLNLQNMAFFDASLLAKAVYYIGVFRELEERGLQGLLDIIRREVQARAATVLVLDGLVSVGETAATYTDFKKFIHDLQTVADLTQCTMFLLTSVYERPTPPEHTMVDGIIELHDRLLGWRAERDINVTKFRGDWYYRGRHAFRISDQGLTVFPRVESLLTSVGVADHVIAPEPTGIKNLDAMLHGGLPSASTTMVLGATGTGKTTLGLNFLSQCSAEKPGLYFGFAEPPQRILAKCRALSLRLESLAESGAVNLIWQPAAEGLIDELAHRLLDDVRKRGVKRVFIDGLNGFHQASAEPERTAYVFTALVTEFRTLGVTSIYSAESAELLDVVPRPPRLEPQFTFGLSTIAENIVLLRFVERGSKLRRLISVAKVRDAGFDPEIREYVISADGFVVDKDVTAAETLLSGAPRYRPPRKPTSA
jgi:circadian clock protein KaiC